CDYLDMPKEISIFSEMKLQIDAPQDSDEWSLNICKSIGSKMTYINPVGGQSFFNKSKFKEADINMYFHSFNLSSYPQGNREFEPALSILDALMFNSNEEIHGMLDRYD